MTSPSAPLDLTLREIMADAHADLSWWRFSMPTGVGPYVLTNPRKDRILNNLGDCKVGRERPFSPYLPIIDAVETLCSAHHTPDRDMSHERRQALDRLKMLQSDPYKIKFRGDIAFRIFNDLDISLFEGRLTGNVFMRWYMQPDPSHPETRNMAEFTLQYMSDVPGDFNDRMRIGMSLNGVGLLLDTRGSIEMVVDTLVHEIIMSQKQFDGRVFEDNC